MLKLILTVSPLFLVTTMWLFFFSYCKLNTRRCGGLQTQGINSAISSLMFFCPGMKMVVLGNGYFYTAICSLRTGLRPPVVYHWLLNSHRAVQITSELGYALTRDGKAGSKKHSRLPFQSCLFFFGGTQETFIVVTGRNADVQVCAILLWEKKEENGKYCCRILWLTGRTTVLGMF